MSKKNFRFSEYLESDEFLEQLDLNLLTPEELIEEAENGSTAAMDRLAMRYLKGSDDFHDFDVDVEKSIYWFKKLAETGSSNAMFNLGMLYYKGYGVKRDFKAAADWMKKADEAGDDDACMFIADFQKVADAIEKADAGDSEAQVQIAKTLMKYASIFNLGSDLEMFGVKPEPIGQEEDYKECIRYATLAAEQNNGEAFWVLSLAYMHGRGVEKDMDKCIECVEKGVEAGNAMCMNSLGCLYWSGDPIEHEKDNAKALDLFLRAAEQGNGYAMKNLGKFYQFGYGCNGNLKKSLEWYEKAAEVLNDPEVDQHVEAFRMIAESDPSFDEDYPPKHSNTGESFVDTNYDFDAVSEEDEDEDEGVDLSNAVNLTKYLPDLVKALRESLGDEAKDLTDKDLEKIIGKLDGETFFSLILMLPKEKKNKILEASGIPSYLLDDEDDEDED